MTQQLAANRHLTAPAGRSQAYYVEFYVRLASDSQLHFDYVGLTAYTQPAFEPPMNNPGGGYCGEQLKPAQVNGTRLLMTNSTPLTNSTTTWQRVSGVLTVPAGGDYENIAIGAFPTATSSPAQAGPASLPTCEQTMGRMAYYYLDDVSIKPLYAGLDQTICLGSTATLGVSGGCALSAASGATYSWSATSAQAGLNATTGASPTATPTSPGTYVYTVTISLPGSPAVTSLVTVTATTVPQAGPPQTITAVRCGSATLGVQCPVAGATYQWTAPGGQTYSGASPTVTLSATTTYTLTVTLPGGTTSTSTTTVTVVQSGFAQAAGGNYNPALTTPNGPPAGQPAYELGEPGRVTTITRNNFSNPNAPTFSGIYHVVGPVLFEDGNFQVQPGTVFYMDGGLGTTFNPIAYPPTSIGGQCIFGALKTYGRADPRHFLQLFVGTGATLALHGATLTSNCDAMWGGIELVQDGILVTDSNTLIEHARVGVLTGTVCRATSAHYHLTNSRFLNNTYGVVVLGEQYQYNGGSPISQITGCTFSSDRAQRRAPDDGPTRGRAAGDGDYTRVGLTMQGETYADGIRNNAFSGLAVGAELASLSLTFEQNHLEKCYDTGIRAFAGVSYNSSTAPTNPADYMTVQNNTVQVPTDVAAPGGQINAANPVLGIDVLNPYQYIEATRFYTNQVSGAVPLSARTRPGYGLQAVDGEDYLQFIGNNWQHLDLGIRLADMLSNAGGYTAGLFENLFQDVGSGVSFVGTNYASYSPYVNCNDFRTYTTGITLEATTDLTQLGYSRGPCENYFDRSGQYITNNRTNGVLLDYYYDSGRNEIPVGATATGVRYMPTTPYNSANSTYCQNRGLQRMAAPSAAQATAWQRQVLGQSGTPVEQRQAEADLVGYYAAADSLPTLVRFAAQLPARNPAAFRRLSLSAMRGLRQQGREGQAQQAKAQLLRYQGNNPEIGAQVRYFDVVGHLQASAGRLTPADSTSLAEVALAPVVAAPAACALLHALRPAWACTGQVAPAQTEVGKTAGLLQIYPNPASGQVQVAAPVGASGTVFELWDLGGRLVRTLRLTADGQGTFSVAGMLAGVYVGRVRGQQAAGTCKVVVLP